MEQKENIETKEKKWKKILIWILVIVVVASVSGGGIYFWQKIEFDKLQNYSQRQIEKLNQDMDSIKSQCENYSENAGKPLPGQCPQKPECPKMIFLEPGNCSGYANPMLVKLGKIKPEVVNIEKVIGENELGENKKIKGSLCQSSVSFPGLKDTEEKAIAEKIKSDGWVSVGSAGTAPRMTRSDFYKGAELLILEITHEPKGGWDGDLAKKKKETCASLDLQCFNSNEIVSTISISLAGGFEN